MKMERVVDALTTCGGHGARRSLEGRKHAAGAGAMAARRRKLLRVFTYLTFRAVMAAITALGSARVRAVGDPQADALKIGQAVRKDGPQSHLVKSGTPTMGGVLILIGIAVATLLWGDLTNRFIWIVMLVTFGFGAIGWVDDYRKVVTRTRAGCRRAKYFWQSVIGLFAASTWRSACPRRTTCACSTCSWRG
jgi:UDP-N-acetylmuramyl pentapeptide phosphotransferase/UDP-N-acetylglucosamine-1-phosphate transferase